MDSLSERERASVVTEALDADNPPVRLRSGSGRYKLCVGRDFETKMLAQNLQGFQGRAMQTDPRGN